MSLFCNANTNKQIALTKILHDFDEHTNLLVLATLLALYGRMGNPWLYDTRRGTYADIHHESLHHLLQYVLDTI